MAPAESADAPSAAARGRRRSGWRQLWAAVLCFGSRRGEASASGRPSWRSRRRKRNVAPVDEVLGAWPPADQEMRRGEEAGKLPLLRSCCILPPACVPGRKRDIKGSRGGSNTHQKQRQREHMQQQQLLPGPQNGKNPPSEAASAQQFQPAEQARFAATATRGIAESREPTRPTTPRGENTGRDEAPARSSTTAACHGTREFGPVAGLSVVAAVSMAGLLGGRLWAVFCVCAWFLALSRLKRKAAPPAAGGTRSSGEGADVIELDRLQEVRCAQSVARARSEAAVTA